MQTDRAHGHTAQVAQWRQLYLQNWHIPKVDAVFGQAIITTVLKPISYLFCHIVTARKAKILWCKWWLECPILNKNVNLTSTWFARWTQKCQFGFVQARHTRLYVRVHLQFAKFPFFQNIMIQSPFGMYFIETVRFLLKSPISLFFLLYCRRHRDILAVHDVNNDDTRARKIDTTRNVTKLAPFVL